MKYPETTVWYVESWTAEDRSDVQYGSAVMIRVRTSEGKIRNCLLTCAHVIRATSASGTKGFGEIHTHRIAISPGEGYVNYAGLIENERKSVVKFVNVSALAPLDLSQITSEAPVRDWVLLEFDSNSHSELFYGSDTVGRLAVKNDVDPTSDRFSIIGYPAGNLRWKQRGMVPLVEPVGQDNFRLQSSRIPGMLNLVGEGESRPGMSGGGVFNSRMELVGLHRERLDSALEQGAVAVSQIRRELWDKFAIHLLDDSEKHPTSDLNRTHEELLLELMLKHFPDPKDIPPDLKGLGSPTQVREGDSTPAECRQYYQELISEMGAEVGGQRMLAACVLGQASSNDSIANRLLQELLAPCERVAHSLEKILKQSGIELGLIGRAYNQAKQKEWESYANFPASTLKFAFSICSAQSATVECDGPLYRFLAELISNERLSTEAREALRDWWESNSPGLSLRGTLPQIKRAPEKVSALIQLVRSTADNIGSRSEAKWRLTATRYWHGTKTHEPLGSVVVTTEKLKVSLSAIWNDVGDVDMEISPVIMEVFLPRDSLWLAIDDWPVEVDGIPSLLGKENPVVLRVVDRSSKSRQSTIRRWPSFVGSSARSFDEIVTSDEADDEGRLRDQFEENELLVCLMVPGLLGSAEHQAKLKCLNAAIAAGLPVVVWARDESGVDSLKATLVDVLKSRPLDLPSKIHELRKQSINVGLLFENAEYWPQSSEKRPSFLQLGTAS